MAVLLTGLLLLVAACGPEPAGVPEAQVRSHLEGHFTVRAEVDSTPDYRGFEVLVAREQGADMDTLAYAVTDSTGAFAVDVTAPAAGVYPLIVSRRGTVLNVSELVVAAGDTAVVDAQFPMGARPLRIRSVENAAWSAFRNTKAQHNQALFRLLQGGAYDDEAISQSIQQTSSILWSLRDAFPQTIGSDLASAESIVMLGGWDDSLALARAAEIEPDNLGYADVVRVARLAKTRQGGADAAIDLVQGFLDRAPGEQRPALQAELVMAYIASEQQDQALEAARALKASTADSTWGVWADRAIYELETLMPGMDAPAFTATTLNGHPLTLDSLRGHVVVLEFYAPQNTVFQRDLGQRRALYEAFAGQPFRLVSISVEPDSLLNEAFFDGRDVPGLHIIAPGGRDGALARTYNVNVLPVRFLIDRAGTIAGKYVGGTLPALRRDAEALLNTAS